MMYRLLSDTDLRILTDEYRRDVLWPRLSRFAREVYGPEADTISIVVDSVYNDETDVVQVTEATVRDAAGVELRPDLRTEWWRETLARGEREYWYTSASEEERIDWLIDDARRDLPVPEVERITYPVQRPPRRTFPAVYVLDGE